MTETTHNKLRHIILALLLITPLQAHSYLEHCLLEDGKTYDDWCVFQRPLTPAAIEAMNEPRTIIIDDKYEVSGTARVDNFGRIYDGNVPVNDIGNNFPHSYCCSNNH